MNPSKPIPDWQLPPGVDRGLWDYLHSQEMVAGYDEQIASSGLAAVDAPYCAAVFQPVGRVLDLGCGTGRLGRYLATRGYEYVGVDLSDEMLAVARHHAPTLTWVSGNLVDLASFPDESFDYAACLFSTLGMVRSVNHREAVLRSAARVLRPRGRLVLHVHHRWFRGLGWRRLLNQAWQTLRGSPAAGDVTMPQAYAGAPLTLHHFTRAEVQDLLRRTGFRVLEVKPLGETGAAPRGFLGRYGDLIAAEKIPTTTITGR